MGRPRKRRRESEHGGDDMLPTNVNEGFNNINATSLLGNFGLVTPPQFQDSDLYAGGNVGGDGAATTPYPSDPTMLGISPGSNFKCV